ncbi:MAG: hypothetical protein WBW73_13985 [Rhodoplanes sp.]
MTSARIFSVSNEEHRLADERVENVGNRHLEGQAPGIMNSLRAWAAKAPKPGAPCSTISSSAVCGGLNSSSLWLSAEEMVTGQTPLPNTGYYA